MSIASLELPSARIRTGINLESPESGANLDVDQFFVYPLTYESAEGIGETLFPCGGERRYWRRRTLDSAHSCM